MKTTSMTGSHPHTSGGIGVQAGAGALPSAMRQHSGGAPAWAARLGLAAAAAWIAVLGGCSPKPSNLLQGYIEGEFIHVASPVSGTLRHLAVRRGMEVKADEPLFELEGEPETAVVRETEQRVAQSRSKLLNLEKGRRASELESIQARLTRAEANLRLSELEFARRQKLIEARVISDAELDTAKARLQSDKAEVVALTADLATAKLGAREDEIQAAREDVTATEAALARARWALAQKSKSAPTNALVHDTLYRPGEFVAAGMPVVSLLPPDNIKVRFFVPQPRLAEVKPGQEVSIRIDGSPAPLRGQVNYVSTQAEFTPPVIYSKESRAKLVFMVEASLLTTSKQGLKPGQPVDVGLDIPQ